MSGMTLVWLVLAGLAAGVINAVAGGGSLLTLPAFLAAGLPPTVANGSNRLGVLLSAGTTYAAYRRQGIDGEVLVPHLLIPVIGGAVLGAFGATQMSDDVLEPVLGAVLVLMGGVLVARPERFLKDGAGAPVAVQAVGAFLAGLYGGFVQAGVGVVLILVLAGLGGRTLLAANAGKVVLIGLFTVPALVVFVASGQVDWAAGMAVAAGSAAGGWIGARLAVWAGDQRLRWVVAAAVVFAGARLMFAS